MKIKELLENKTVKVEPPKPRNFVAKNTPTSGAGAHRDKKKELKQGKEKHKKQIATMENATTGETTAGMVTVGAVYPNKPAKSLKNKNGTVKNALDMKDTNLLTGGSIKR